mmetsp:Transcript_28956/g.62380  ORF Transcript_28956/g.62380 Transcript_28956/m.62380 type:complete len:170 (-) Transcript_28956:1059-1568(-)
MLPHLCYLPHTPTRAMTLPYSRVRVLSAPYARGLSPCSLSPHPSSPSSPTSPTSPSSAAPSEAHTPEAVFLLVVIRLTFVLTVSTLCFALRVIFLILKIAELHTRDNLTTPEFAMYGVVWFTLADFLPRVVPSLAFMYLMRTKRPRQARSSLSEKGGRVELTAVRAEEA